MKSKPFRGDPSFVFDLGVILCLSILDGDFSGDALTKLEFPVTYGLCEDCCQSISRWGSGRRALLMAVGNDLS